MRKALTQQRGEVRDQGVAGGAQHQAGRQLGHGSTEGGGRGRRAAQPGKRVDHAGAGGGRAAALRAHHVKHLRLGLVV